MKQAILIALILASWGAAQDEGSAPERGLASWYGEPYHGRVAASGEIYDMDELTAAHRTLPFGTVVKVRRLDTGKSVVVRINDRGPIPESRVIDLSRAAAQKLGMVEPGVVPVALEVVQNPTNDSASARVVYAVQIGAFRLRQNAERTLQSAIQYGTARMVFRGGETDLWSVVVGEAQTRVEAEQLLDKIRGQAHGMKAAFVVRVEFPAVAVVEQ